MARDVYPLLREIVDVSFPKRWAEVCELAAEIVGTIPFSPLVLTPAELAERRAKGDQFFEEILAKGRVLYTRHWEPSYTHLLITMPIKGDSNAN